MDESQYQERENMTRENSKDLIKSERASLVQSDGKMDWKKGKALFDENSVNIKELKDYIQTVEKTRLIEIDSLKSSLVKYKCLGSFYSGSRWIRLYPQNLQYGDGAKPENSSEPEWSLVPTTLRGAAEWCEHFWYDLNSIDSIECIREGNVYSTSNTYSKHSLFFDAPIIKTNNVVHDDRAYRLTVRFNDGIFFTIVDPSESLLLLSESIRGACRSYKPNAIEYNGEYVELFSKYQKRESQDDGLPELFQKLELLEQDQKSLSEYEEHDTRKQRLIVLGVAALVLILIIILIIITNATTTATANYYLLNHQPQFQFWVK
jgi:hypothetical protein